MKLAIAFFLSVLASAPAAACDIDTLSALTDRPLDPSAAVTREVKDAQSTEGGEWRIYRTAALLTSVIVRVDGGESGRNETRLDILDNGNYVIASARIDYLRHAFVEGSPNGIARMETKFYYFCGGKLHLPPADASTMDIEAYKKEAEEARQSMLGQAEIAEFTKGIAK